MREQMRIMNILILPHAASGCFDDSIWRMHQNVCRNGTRVRVHWAELPTHDVNLCTIHAVYAQRAGFLEIHPMVDENTPEPSLNSRPAPLLRFLFCIVSILR